MVSLTPYSDSIDSGQGSLTISGRNHHNNSSTLKQQSTIDYNKVLKFMQNDPRNNGKTFQLLLDEAVHLTQSQVSLT